MGAYVTCTAQNILQAGHKYTQTSSTSSLLRPPDWSSQITASSTKEPPIPVNHISRTQLLEPPLEAQQHQPGLSKAEPTHT